MPKGCIVKIHFKYTIAIRVKPGLLLSELLAVICQKFDLSEKRLVLRYVSLSNTPACARYPAASDSPSARPTPPKPVICIMEEDKCRWHITSQPPAACHPHCAVIFQCSFISTKSKSWNSLPSGIINTRKPIHQFNLRVIKNGE